MMFKATIIRNLRDVKTMTPKVLLLDITFNGEPFRDHCWVDLTPELEKFIPRQNHQKLTIQFEAKLKKYKKYSKSEKEECYTLKTLSNISILNRRI